MAEHFLGKPKQNRFKKTRLRHLYCHLYCNQYTHYIVITQASHYNVCEHNYLNGHEFHIRNHGGKKTLQHFKVLK